MKLFLHPLRCVGMLLALQVCILTAGFSQDCSGLAATYSVTESRCTATGTLQIHATGGSGNYNYRIIGSATSDFTSSSLITGLKPGTYSAIIKDIVSGCVITLTNISITGFYQDPRFGITETDVTCMNGNDGTISVAALTNGRSPFVFTIVAPSAMGIGSSNATGTFTNLIPGSYSVQLMDSCGGIQTRNISVQNYNWSLSGVTVTQQSCTGYHVAIALLDSKGRTNASGTAFNGFTYGFVNAPGDTAWSASNNFDFNLAQKRTATFVAKDNCGLVQAKNWSNTLVPSVQANIIITNSNCAGFTATVSGQQNLTTPVFCLTDGSGNAVSGQPCNSTGVFTNVPYGAYCIKITNSCYDTVITRCFSQAQALPAITGAISMTNYSCTDFQAAVTGQQNLTNPQYCLFDQANNPVVGFACNTTGVFAHIPYGAYTIKVTDGCTMTVLSLNFSASEKTKSVNASVTTNGYTCTTFNASITGQTNLNTPQYCLVDSVGNPITCNSTGIFNNLGYGSYCINITDACSDTTIKRCMTVAKPVPSGGAATISNKTCSGVTVTITGQSNVYNGNYCLLDSAGNTVTCNSTGIFTNIPYGSYCAKTTDGCSGTILTNCFKIVQPAPFVGPAVVSNKTCSGFTVAITTQQNLTNPSFCLYDRLNNLVGSCNSTGTFIVTGFGAFKLITTDGCTGKVFTSNVTVIKPVPTVGPAVNISNQSCISFTATITGQTNLTNPHYFIKDNGGNPVDNNNTGVFSNLPYGAYCIDVVTGCMDTTITRCFTAAPNATQMTVSATPSCTYNASDLAINVTAGFAPYTASVYDASDSLLASVNSSNSQMTITGLPALTAGNQYKVVVAGACGTPATQYVSGQQSAVLHHYTITPKCPSSITLNGSGDLLVNAVTNLGTLNLTIIAKDGVADTIGYAFKSGNDFTFSNLESATYVIAYSFSGCSTVINDTIAIPEYSFPALAPSGAYQCDNNSFSVGASVSGGMAPYTYQIIGSSPSSPTINSVPQTNPVFSINNGVQYSLVRLRAIDACGNATLNDVSILPLANTIVTATSNCIYQSTTLSTDLVPNATYTWFKKRNMNSTDSVLVGTDPTYTIPAISVGDTGIYVNRMSVNSGCLTKLSYFHLDGMCGGLFTLPDAIALQGKMLTSSTNELSWTAPGGMHTLAFIVERMDNDNGSFSPVGNVAGNPSDVPELMTYIDNTSGNGTYYYRLKIVSDDNKYSYSNTVLIKAGNASRMTVYPNPVSDVLHITIPGDETQRYSISLVNVAGQVIFTGARYIPENGEMLYHRNPQIKAGYYFLRIVDTKNNAVNVFKLRFN